MDLGIIGNCQYSALIDSSARVVWLCWPRFDSSSIFAALLDEGKGGDFAISPPGEKGKSFRVKQEYIKNTNILRTEFSSTKGVFEVMDFAPRFFQYERIFQPKMLVRIVKPLSGSPVLNVRCRPHYDYGRIIPKVYTGSNHIH